MKEKLIVFTVALLVSMTSNSAVREKITPPAQGECNENNEELIKAATAQQIKELDKLTLQLLSGGIIRYITGRDSVLSDYREISGETALTKALDETKNKLDEDQKNYWSSYVTYKEGLINLQVKEFANKNSHLKGLLHTHNLCKLNSIYQGSVNFQDTLDRMTRVSLRSGNFDKFNIAINDCVISDTVGTQNPYSEPDKWVGSRFVVIDAHFKNVDTEGRLPFEGALIIKTENGEELKYDTTESILQKGYGIYFKSINPFITMPTKIVYRIPNEISGEVLWEPGRNPEGKRLWCGFVSPKA